MDFYKQLNYSLGNEDWRVEAQALRVNAGDKVICVTASGDRPLHLLMTDCAEIISIDLNRTQNFLLELKIAAINQLDYEKYLAFLGCTPMVKRYEVFKQIQNQLSPEGARFWQEHKKMLHKGIIYQGRIERLTGLAAKFFNLVRRGKIKSLLAFTDLASQREFVTNKWDTRALSKVFEVFVNPCVSKLILNDPGLNQYVEYAKSPGLYIYQRMLNYLNNNLACESPLLQLLFTGKINDKAYFPYLSLANFSSLRRDTQRIKMFTGNVIELLEQDYENEINAFSLSDIASYMPQDVFGRLLHAMVNAAKTGARFCLREFISHRFIPADL
jgi:S-adenosylmethionine-diacylglycerol 3-amino-3-carboxypropyl transferase